MPNAVTSLRDRIVELELQLKLEREELRLKSALLTGVEAMLNARDQETVYRALCETLQSSFGAEQVIILGYPISAFDDFADDGLVLLHSTNGLAQTQVTDSVANWFKKRRNVTDLLQTDIHVELQGLLGLVRSLVSVPYGGTSNRMGAIICTHSSPAYFKSEDLGLLRRMAGQTESAIEAAATRLRIEGLASVIEGSAAGVTLMETFGVGGRVLYANRAFQSITGVAPDVVRGMTFLSTGPADTPERERLREAFRTGKSGSFVVRNRKPDQSSFWNEIFLDPVSDPDGTLKYMLATHGDVTAKIEAEREIERLTTRIEDAISSVPEAILIVDQSKKVVFQNEAMQSLRQLHDPSSHQSLEDSALFQDACSGKFVEHEFNSKDGRSFIIRTSPTRDHGVFVLASDVTELKNTTADVRRKALAMDKTAEGIAVADPQGRLSYANAAFLRMMGLSLTEGVVGKNWIASFKSEQVFSAVESAHAAARTDGVAGLLLRRNAMEEVLSFEITLTPIDNDFVVVARDVTKVIKAEDDRIALQRKLLDHQRNDSIGRLAAGVAHDFNNLLAAISGSATLLLESELNASLVQKCAERIDVASTRASKMINRFLDLGQATKTRTVVDLRSVILESKDLLESTLQSGTQLLTEVCDDVLTVECDQSDVLRVALNLLQNAQDAFEFGDGLVTQTLSRVSGAAVDQAFLRVGKIDKQRVYARYSVIDTASGIQPEVMKRLFKESYSSKGVRGSGVGMLAIADIIQSHDGALALQSTVGKGTRIDVYFGMSEAYAAQSASEDIGAVRLDGFLVLLVDDDPDVLDVVSAYLERVGAQVATCEDPHQAVAAIEDDPDAWSIVVTDYNMPGMNGGTLAKKVRSLREGLSVVVVTALARKISDENLSNGTVAAICAKPVDLPALARTIATYGKPTLGVGT